MFEEIVRPEIQALEPYVPGRSIDEIRAEYGIEKVIKMASNENPLGTSPLVQKAICAHAGLAFRYPAGGNPRLVEALANYWGVDGAHIVIGNGSDEIIDMIIRMLTRPGKDNIVCFEPCFSLYPIQGRIQGIEVRRQKLNDDFSFDFDKLVQLVDENTRLVFITTPDNPSGYCPRPEAVAALAAALPPQCLLVIDEAYIDFAPEEGETESDWSLFAAKKLPSNAAVIRTFSKCYGLAGMRIGVGYVPKELASYYWRARLPFSVNILAEEAVLAALADTNFKDATLETVLTGRKALSQGLEALGCTVWPSRANFVMFKPKGLSAQELYQGLLRKGVIVRALKSYSLPELIRVSVGNSEENALFLQETALLLQGAKA